MEKTQTPGVPTPMLALVIVIDTSNKTDRGCLLETMAKHLNLPLRKETVVFCETNGDKHYVVEQIMKCPCHAIMYYQTSTGITELYKKEVVRRASTDIPQHHVPRKDMNRPKEKQHSDLLQVA